MQKLLIISRLKAYIINLPKVPQNFLASNKIRLDENAQNGTFELTFSIEAVRLKSLGLARRSFLWKHNSEMQRLAIIKKNTPFDSRDDVTEVSVG